MAHGLLFTAPGAIALGAFDAGPVQPGQVRIRVAGCGLCHTDISFFTGAVRTKMPLPLVLGHEIAGTVVEAGSGAASWLGQDVLVPAVIPCDECALCRDGRPNACQKQLMPGNDCHGGFADEIVIPARHLVPVPADRGGYALADLSVIADAVTTPYQAIDRAGVAAGDLVIVIGIGGIGSYAVQIARARGAHVAAIDVDPAKLERLSPFGVEWTFNAADTDGPTIKKALLKASGVITSRWRILEMSGTARGQEMAWSLLVPASTLGVIGFTMDKPAVRLSNLMALDATAFGNWGCSPALYPAALALVTSGQVALTPFIEHHPLSDGPALFAKAAAHEPGTGRRAILIPE